MPHSYRLGSGFRLVSSSEKNKTPSAEEKRYPI